MAWRMPAETAPHERTWMAFPREGVTLGESLADREEGYAAWTAVARAIAEFEPVTMVVDPSERDRARRMLGDGIEQIEAPLDEFWMRDVGPTFVVDDERPGVLGAVDWTFNGWGAPEWAEWRLSAKLGRFVGEAVGAELVSSLLVNEGGGIHVDGEGTVLVTETVQLDPRRNPFADRARVEAELARTIGTSTTIWLPRGLTRDYDDFGTSGHVDIVATITSPGRLLLHEQRDPAHPDHAVSHELRDLLATQTDAAGRSFEIVDIPAPATLRDDEGFVDWSYVNHLVVNGGVIACGFGEPEADAAAAVILAEAYPGRRVVTVDARPLFARGGGIHCITQQQPALDPSSRFARSGSEGPDAEQAEGETKRPTADPSSRSARSGSDRSVAERAEGETKRPTADPSSRFARSGSDRSVAERAEGETKRPTADPSSRFARSGSDSSVAERAEGETKRPGETR